MKFKLPKKLQKSLQEKINEYGGFGNLPDVKSWIDESATQLFNTGSVELGWVHSDDVNNVELVKFTKESVDTKFKGAALIRCENKNGEDGFIGINPNEAKNGFEVYVIQPKDNNFMDRVLFHSKEMGLLDSITNKLYKDLVA